ncbi:MAG: phosphorylase family protein [Nitrospirota bacterium]
MEINGIKKRGSFRRAGHGCFEGEINGHPAVLAVSGMGDGNACRTAKESLSHYPDALAYVSVGLSAALLPGLVPGDIVAAAEIIETSSGNIYPCDPGLVDSLAKIKCRAGKFAAVSKTVITSAEKKEIAKATGTVALDMESGGAARACIEASVPFISIRAISDTLDEDLPVDFNLFMGDGKIDLMRLIFYLMAHPGSIPPLIRLGKNSRIACERLGEAINKWT